MKDILQGLKPEKSIGLRTLRALLLEHQAHALPWRGVPVTGFLLKDQVEVSLKRQGLAGWFAPMLEAHKEALERALKEGKTGVFFVSDPEKLVLTPFAFPRKKELLADLGEEPYRFPQEIVSPKAPMVRILPPFQMEEAEVEVDPLLCFTPPYRAELALLRELGLEENPKALVLALALYRGDPTSNETLARRALAHLPVFRNMPRLSPRAQAFLQAFEKALPSFLEQAKEEDSLFLLQGTKATAYPLEPQKGGPEVVHRSSLEAWKGRAPFTAQAILEGEIPSLRDFLRSQALLAALLTHPGDEYLGAKHRALKHKLPQSLLLDALKELHSPLGPLLVPERNLLREVEVPVPEASLLRWKEAFLEVSEEGLYFLAETRRGLYLALLPGRQVYLNRLDKALSLRTGLEA